MNMLFNTISFYFLLLHSRTEAYRKFLNETEEKMFCMAKETHFIMNPGSACCSSQVVNPGINLEEHWEKCAVPQDSAEKAQDAAWGVYTCVLKEINGDGNSITLSKFAEKMTEKYPEELKGKISAEAGSAGDVTADLSDSKAVDKLRITYYDVEKEVCSGMESKAYGKARECVAWDEDLHRGGKCCKKSSFPFDIGFKSVFNQDFSQFEESCNFTIRTILNRREPKMDWNTNKPLPLNPVPESMISAMLEICGLTCTLINPETIEKNPRTILEYTDVVTDQELIKQIKDNAYQLSPAWLGSNVKNKAAEFARQKLDMSATLERMRNFEFPDASDWGNSTTDRYLPVITFTNTTKAESNFMSRRFSNEFIHIPTVCSAHFELMSYIELYLQTEECNEAPGGSAAEGESNNETPPAAAETTDPPENSENPESPPAET